MCTLANSPVLLPLLALLVTLTTGMDSLDTRLMDRNDKLINGSVKGKEEGESDDVEGDEGEDLWSGHFKSQIYSSMASIEISDATSADAFDFLSHQENNKLWQKNVSGIELAPDSPATWGIGTKYLSYGNVAFLRDYKTTRHLTVTRFDSTSSTKVMEVRV